MNHPLEYVSTEILRFKTDQGFNQDFFWQIGRDEATQTPILTVEAFNRGRKQIALTDGSVLTLRAFLYEYFGLRVPDADKIAKIWPDLPGPRVMVCLPQRDSVKAGYNNSLLGLTMATHGTMPILFAPQRASNIAFVRNMLVQCAVDGGADGIFFIDDDMVFPTKSLLQLVAHDKDIVGACYVKRTKPHTCLGHTLSGATTFTGAGLEPMRRMPTGLLYVKTSVFRRIPRPWFSEVQFPWNEMQSDDYYFSDQAFNAGIELFCDKDLTWEVGHIGEEIFGMMKPDAVPAQQLDWSSPSGMAAQ